jgi:hypothetical protein
VAFAIVLVPVSRSGGKKWGRARAARIEAQITHHLPKVKAPASIIDTKIDKFAFAQVLPMPHDV